ncbi:hypothetical protein [Thermoflexus sp.]|uniref:hypothetical protein n=1 Tax=Thermoflexus sp. TaxID=1969742 RepID=UPI0035E44151
MERQQWEHRICNGPCAQSYEVEYLGGDLWRVEGLLQASVIPLCPLCWSPLITPLEAMELEEASVPLDRELWKI